MWKSKVKPFEQQPRPPPPPPDSPPSKPPACVKSYTTSRFSRAHVEDRAPLEFPALTSRGCMTYQAIQPPPSTVRLSPAQATRFSAQGARLCEGRKNRDAEWFELDVFFGSWRGEKKMCGMSMSLPVHTGCSVFADARNRESGAQIWWKGFVGIHHNVFFMCFLLLFSPCSGLLFEY